MRGSGFGGATLPVATIGLSLSASVPELFLSLLLSIKRLQLLVPLLLIDPLFISHSPLEPGGFGGLGFWGDGLSCLLGRRSPGLQAPVIPALVSSLHQLEDIAVCIRRQAVGWKLLVDWVVYL